jgi:hypothetical protein
MPSHQRRAHTRGTARRSGTARAGCSRMGREHPSRTTGTLESTGTSEAVIRVPPRSSCEGSRRNRNQVNPSMDGAEQPDRGPSFPRAAQSTRSQYHCVGVITRNADANDSPKMIEPIAYDPAHRSTTIVPGRRFGQGRPRYRPPAEPDDGVGHAQPSKHCLKSRPPQEEPQGQERHRATLAQRSVTARQRSARARPGAGGVVRSRTPTRCTT